MSSVECLRDFVNERLTAAAEEIFRVFKQTIVEYEEEIDRQRRLLDIFWKPEVKLHRIELPQLHICREEEDATEQQLCNQERNYSLDQEEPEPPQIKEELCSRQDEDQFELKLETESSVMTPTDEETDHSEQELEGDDQLLSNNTHAAESKDEKGGQHGDSGLTGDDSGSTRNTDSNPQNQHHKSYSINIYNHNQSETHCITQSDKKAFKCETCGKDFKNKSKLNIHQRVHTGEKPYSCKTCGKHFRFSSVFKVHLRIHTGEKPYLCKTCGKTFGDISLFKRHLRIHTGEKPYSCKTCGKDFRLGCVLKRHLRTHAAKKPSLCQMCGRDFKSSGALLIHMRRAHNGERLFDCNTCGRRFYQMSELSEHIKVHTKCP